MPHNMKIVSFEEELDGNWEAANIEQVMKVEAVLKANLSPNQRVDFVGGRLNGKDHNNGEIQYFLENRDELPEQEEENPVDLVLAFCKEEEHCEDEKKED